MLKGLFSRLSNWRTTVLGVAAIMTAIGDLITQLAQSDFDATRFGTDITGIFTGLGLLFARDAAAAQVSHDEDRVRISQNQADIEEVQQVAVIAAEHAVVAKQEAVVAKQEATALRNLVDQRT
jgi:hypothetical protein